MLMQPILAALLSRWFISFIGTAILAGLAWFFGPFLPQLEDPVIRIALIVIMLLVWAGANLLLDMRRRLRDLVLAHGVTANVAGASATNEEAEALRNRLTTAL